MGELSYIYSIFNHRINMTELQLCFTHQDLTRLNRYCDRKDKYRKRGFLQGDLSIGRDLYNNLRGVVFTKAKIKEHAMWYSDSLALRDEQNYTFYRNGLIIRPIDLVCKIKNYNYFKTYLNQKNQLIIECDRYKYESFFQHLKAFSLGYWGDVFLFSPNFALSTCIHDVSAADMKKLNPDI